MNSYDEQSPPPSRSEVVPEVSYGRTVAIGATWTYAAQLFTAVVQFGYAAVTSRIVSPTGFGEYGIALTVSAFVTLLANGGLSQAVGRLTELDPRRIRALNAFGIALGVASGITLFLTGGLWAQLWASPGSAETIRAVGLAALTGPSFGLATGLMRRKGEFKRLALLTFLTNVLGMVLGLAGVMIWRTPESLLISQITSQAALLIWASVTNRHLLFGAWRLSDAREEISFSGRLTLANMISYVSGNIGEYSVTIGVGTVALGQWNRANVVTTVPFNQIQSAMTQAVYPEFRHDIGSPARAQRVWPDLLALVGWLAIPAAAIAAVVIPYLLPILLGPQWHAAATLGPVLSVTAGILMVVVMLGSAIQAISKFRWIWIGQGVLLLVEAVGAVATVLTHDWVFVFATTLVGLLAQHAVHVLLCRSAGYLLLRPLLRHYAQIASSSAGLAAVFFGNALAISSDVLVLAIGVPAFTAVVGTALLWRFWRRLWPVQLAIKYKLIRT